MEHVRNTCPHNKNAIFKDKHTDNSKTSVSGTTDTIEKETNEGKATASAQAFNPAQKQAEVEAAEMTEEEPPSQEDEKGFKTVKIRKKNQGKAEKTKDSKSTEEMDTQKSEVRVSKRSLSMKMSQDFTPMPRNKFEALDPDTNDDSSDDDRLIIDLSPINSILLNDPHLKLLWTIKLLNPLHIYCL